MTIIIITTGRLLLLLPFHEATRILIITSAFASESRMEDGMSIIAYFLFENLLADADEYYYHFISMRWARRIVV